MRKVTIYAGFCICLFVLTTGSCSRALVPDGTITVVNSGFLSGLESTAEQHENVTLEWITAESRGELPQGSDVVLWTGDRATSSWAVDQELTELSPLKARMQSSEDNHLFQLKLHNQAHNYIAPIGGYAWGLIYRPDVIKRIIPEFSASDLLTLNDLENTARKLQESGLTPFALGAEFGWPAAAWFSYFDIRLNGGQVHRDLIERKRAYTDSSSIQALEYLLKYAEQGWFSPEAHSRGWIESVRDVSEGRAGFVLLGAYGFDRVPSHVQTEMLPFPRLDTQTAPDAEIGQLLGLAIPADSANVEGAAGLIDQFILAGSPGIGSDGYRFPTQFTEPLSAHAEFSHDIIMGSSTILPSPDRWASPRFVQHGFRLFRSAMQNPAQFSAAQLAELLEQAY